MYLCMLHVRSSEAHDYNSQIREHKKKKQKKTLYMVLLLQNCPSFSAKDKQNLPHFIVLLERVRLISR